MGKAKPQNVLHKDDLNRKLQRLADWRQRMMQEELPILWQDLIDRLNSEAARATSVLDLPKRRFADALSQEAREYYGRFRSERDEQKMQSIARHVEDFLEGIKLLLDSPPAILPPQAQTARNEFDRLFDKDRFLRTAQFWSPIDRDPGTLLPSSVRNAYQSVVRAIHGAIDQLEQQLDNLRKTPPSSDGKSSPELRERIRELDRLHHLPSRDKLLRIVNEDPRIKKLMLDRKVSKEQVKYALGKRSREIDGKTQGK